MAKDGKHVIHAGGVFPNPLLNREGAAAADTKPGTIGFFDAGTSTDPVAMRTNAIGLRDVVRVTNSQYAPQTWYVSAEIMSNFERYYDVNATRTVLEEILKLSGIAAIKEDAGLSGNEILIVPLTAGVIAPIVGQAIGTVADPRPFYNSDYIWRTWGAMGLMVKQDINNKYSVIHASS